MRHAMRFAAGLVILMIGMALVDFRFSRSYA